MIILILQIFMFTSLNTVVQLQDMFMGRKKDTNTNTVVTDNLYDQFMVIFGIKYKIEDGNNLRLVLYIAYAFLILIVNMKLLISIIGEMYAKQQISRVPMCYKMKAMYLVENAKLYSYLHKIFRSRKSLDDLDEEAS